MTTIVERIETSRPGKALLGRDQLGDLFHFVAIFVVFGVLERTTASLSNVSLDGLREPMLMASAVQEHLLLSLLFATAAVAGLVLARDRLFAPWESLEHGQALRWLAAPSVMLLAWGGSLYEFNFFVDQTHAVDRIAIVALGICCLIRPAFLLPFAMQSRIISGQFDAAFGSAARDNVDDLLVMALLALAATFVWFVVTGRRDTSPVLLVIAAAIASHFFVPGKAKVVIGWLGATDISNLPLSSYTAGWRGSGDGSWSRSMASFARSGGDSVLIGTLVLELGAAVAVLHHRLFRVWLLGSVAFHALVFAFTGFWFLAWVVLEVSLFVLLTRPSLQGWASRNARPARAIFAVLIVVIAGSTLFRPPGLAWFDAPISYGYRMEARGISGTTYQVPLSALGPVSQELVFYRAQLGDFQPLTGSYGALTSADELRQFETLQSMAEVQRLERPFDPATRARGEAFMLLVVAHLNEQRQSWWSPFSPPDHFWTSSPANQRPLDEPIQQLDVYALTAIHRLGDQPPDRRLVLTITIDDDNNARVTFPEDPERDD